MRTQTVKELLKRQDRIDKQASKISSLEVQDRKLTQLLEPKFLVNTITHALAHSINISRGNKPQNINNGMGVYTGKPSLGKPRFSQLALGIDSSLNPELSCWYYKNTSHLKENCIKFKRRPAIKNRQPENNNTDWLLKQLEN